MFEDIIKAIGIEPYYRDNNVAIFNGDCRDILPLLSNMDAIVTDPPYGLVSINKRFGNGNAHNTPAMETKEGSVWARKAKGFMGKEWDGSGIEYDVEMWQGCINALKNGGHLLAFGGTRTYHRMACAIEDAGFEIRDMIEWVYGSGFPKSLNIGKSVNQLETNEWSKIGKALDNTDQKSIIEVWKGNLNNVKIAETQSLKNQIIAGQDTPSENFVVLNVVQNSNQENSNLLVSFAEQNLNEAQAINTKINTALLSVETEIRQLQNNVKSAEQQSQNQSLKSWNIFTAQCDVKEWLNENTVVNHKVDEALKTLRGNKKYSNEEITSVLCAVIPSILKHTILNQSRTFQNLDTKSQTDFLSAINVIITKYTAENLISNTVAILKSKAIDKIQGNEREAIGRNPNSRENCDKTNTLYESGTVGKTDILTKGTSEWEGWGTALKPAHEPVCLARKPLIGTVAQNVLEYGTGGINIDGCRVGVGGDYTVHNAGISGSDCYQWNNGDKKASSKEYKETPGRFPANLIHDGSDEVLEIFPECKGWSSQHHNNFNPYGGNALNESVSNREGDYEGYNDNGSAARFFYCAKASKSERNANCDGIEKDIGHNRFDKCANCGGYILQNPDKCDNSVRQNNIIKGNNHPTVKPLALMEYLIKLITPPKGIVLDPFMGSGSTLVAARKLGYKAIGIELNKDYAEIAVKRLAQGVLL